MAILLDKEGLQNYANKMVLAENRKVGSKSLPTALADVDKLIEEMKGQFEAEYGSALDMKLENNENVFSVGTGNGIDKRDEVENSFTDVEVFGNSMVNLYGGVREHTASASEVSNFDEITMVKPNTKYTMGYWVKSSNKISNPSKTSFFRIQGYSDDNTPINVWLFGLEHDVETVYTYHEVEFSTPSNISYIILTLRNSYLEWGLDSNTSYIKDVVIVEGDYTNKSLPPYFEGLQSVGEKEGRNEIEVLSIGENLFDNANIERGNISSGVNSGSDLTSHSFMRTPNFIQVKPNTVYSIKFHTPTNNVTLEKIMEYKAKIKDESGWSKSIVTTATQFMFTTNANTKYVRLTFKNSVDSNIVVTNEHLINSKIHFKEYVYSDEYLPYKEDKKQISLNEPLRGLPNGVRDEISNGKLIRRVGKVVLNGSEDWEFNPYTSEGEEKKRYRSLLPELTKKSGRETIISDKFFDMSVSGLHFEGGAFAHGGYIYIYKSLDGTINGFKQWLQANPTTVYYELETPVITELPTPSLQCWKNGTISIDSTVPPTTTHTVALNKPAQIKRNIEELTTLRHKVKTLEEQYDQIALEQAHKLQLLNHSIELEGKR